MLRFMGLQRFGHDLVTEQQQKEQVYELVFDVEKAMAPHSSTLAWKIPWMEEPGRGPSIGSHRVERD